MRFFHLIHKTVIIAVIAAFTSCQNDVDKMLVILHTNDTHSHIDADPETGTGGVLRRKAVIDSIRKAASNVILVDAGDAVQGSLYYTLYKGEVESMVMNELGYDIALLGNHEFDNGIDALANQYKQLNAAKISSNYDFSETAVNGMFSPFEIKIIDGKTIGFIGVNINPEGLISPRKYSGIKYSDCITRANETADFLKREKNADFIVALTHIGYGADTLLAKQSRYIDLIIGGHSHDAVDRNLSPTLKHQFKNLEGKNVTVAQSGSNGHYIGKACINLTSRKISTQLIKLDNSFDNNPDHALIQRLQPYKHKVDSLLSIEIIRSETKMDKSGEPLINFISDFIHLRGEELTHDKIDIALMNRGGIRNSLPEGMISKGDLMMAFPFDNFITVIEIRGDSICKALDLIARKNHLSLSKKSRIDFSADKIYRLASINYITEGGDGMTPLISGTPVAVSPLDLKDDLLNYFSKAENRDLTITPDTTNRVQILQYPKQTITNKSEK